jgi:hypothetical protein
MGGDPVLATVTHILVDEVHERNRFTGFLLIALRDALAKFRSLRLVLMSSTIDTPIFTKYFNNCPVIVGNVYVIAYCHAFFYIKICVWAGNNFMYYYVRVFLKCNCI